MRRLILLIMVCFHILTFSFDTKEEIYHRIAEEYDTENKGIRIYEKKGILNIEGPRGISKIYFQGNIIEKIIITHKVKNIMVDRPLIENLLLNTGYFINEPEILNSRLSEKSEGYMMEMDIKLSGIGIVSKIFDMVYFSKTYGLLYNDGREKQLTIRITKKE